MSNSIFLSAIAEHLLAVESLKECQAVVEESGKHLTDILKTGGKIMLCGNGGSAADSQHLAAELTGRFINDRRPLAGLALSTDSSALTCISNDYSFDEIFVRQIRGLGKRGDALIGISTSGNSMNVYKAIEEAKTMGILTIGLLGRGGGMIAEICDYGIVVPSKSTARIQEAHILIGHVFCSMIERGLEL